MSEYLIEVLRDGQVTHVVNVNIKNRKEATLSAATRAGYLHCTKFKVKGEAVKVAKKIDGAQVVPSYGGYVNSSKTSVAPIQSKVNKNPPYRSI